MNRFNFKRMLNNQFDVKRKSRTPDGKGGQRYTFDVVGTVKGRMTNETTRAKEQFIAGKYTAEITHVFFTLPDEDVQRGDVLDRNGKTFRVLAAKEPSEMDHHIEVACQEIDPKSSNID